jgi:predicted SnoaL-like aldol condensation-catalyzing enzyme
MNINKIKTFTCSATVLIMVLPHGACQAGSDSQTALEEANLQKAVYCMDLLENQKDLETSRRECFGETYTQHTPWIADGVDGMLNIFACRFEKYLDFAMEIKRTAADGDLVGYTFTQKERQTLLATLSSIFFE